MCLIGEQVVKIKVLINARGLSYFNRILLGRYLHVKYQSKTMGGSRVSKFNAFLTDFNENVLLLICVASRTSFIK